MSDGKNWNASGRMTLCVAVFAALAVLHRLVPYLFDLGQQAQWAWNFSPIGAVALFAGARWRSRFALLTPIAIMLASHLLMWPFLAAKGYATFGWATPILYGSFVVYALIGRLIRGSSSPLWIGGGALLGAVQFYLVTNLACWAGGDGATYAMNLTGLGHCYYEALPFFRATLCGDLAYAGLFFGVYALSMQVFQTGEGDATGVTFAAHPKFCQRFLMVDNAPYLSCQHAGLTIEGYSRAAVQSYWRIPELKIGFDLGAQPWDFMGTPTWLLTHTHLDHIAALPVYVARRRMMRMAPPDIYLPAYALEDVRRLLLIFHRLDRGRMLCNLHGVTPGEEIELSREHVVVPFATTHTIPSVGYVVWERRFKLKEEYFGLPGEKIRDLRLSGVPVTHEVRTPILAYIGDSSPAGLDAHPSVYQAKILITEMSFVRPNHRREKIHKFGHMHLDDFIERADRFENELIICAHFSTRYNPPEVRRVVEAKLPQRLLDKVRLWL